MEYICRVKGLTSKKGLQLNNSSAIAYIDDSKYKPNEEDATNGVCERKQQNHEKDIQRRIPVLIDGNPGGPVLLLPQNIHIFPKQRLNWNDTLNDLPTGTDVFHCSIGVGRHSLRDDVFHATSVDERTQKRITQHTISHTIGPRCRGNLEAIEQYLKLCIMMYHTKVCSDYIDPNGLSLPLIFKVTDLNVARALNDIATSDECKALAPSLNLIMQRITKMIRSVMKKRILCFKFESHRIGMDDYYRSHSQFHLNNVSQMKDVATYKGRYNALKNGRYKIYPCPHETYLDAMEVRFIESKKGNKTQMTDPAFHFFIKQEIFLDYGVHEIILYVQNVIAMKEIHRLLPKILAQIDPQMFWSIVLHPNAFLTEIKDSYTNTMYPNSNERDDISLNDIMNGWNYFLTKGVLKNRIDWIKTVERSGIILPNNVVNGNDWNFDSENTHKRISMNISAVATMMMIDMASEIQLNKEFDITLDKNSTIERTITVETLDIYKNTKLERVMEAVYNN